MFGIPDKPNFIGFFVILQEKHHYATPALRYLSILVFCTIIIIIIITLYSNTIFLQTNIHSVNTNNIGSPDLSNGDNDNNEEENRANEVYIMNPKHEDRATSFFAQPGILAGHYFLLITSLLTSLNHCNYE